jgi:hypothetical protein
MPLLDALMHAVELLLGVWLFVMVVALGRTQRQIRKLRRELERALGPRPRDLR